MNVELQYLELLKDILENGCSKGDRTGTGTISVFGRQIRHKMSEGFPVITTKKMAWKQIVTELLWFLRGDTNIKYLLDNDCHIWDGDAYQAYLREHSKNPNETAGLNGGIPFTKDEFITLIKTSSSFAHKWGELGKVYGHGWRNWNDSIDQIKNLIFDLKTNPDSRRLLVSAWNPSDLPNQVLPPCHYGFQVYTRELTLKERFKLWENLPNKDVMDFPIGPLEDMTDEIYHNTLTQIGVPERSISLMWSQRSCDFLLGIPFNIASYATLLEILAKEVNMVPDELIGNLGDCHIYSNHIEQVKEQISRTPYKLPTLKFEVTNLLENLMDWKPSDFSILNYESHPAIKAPLSN
jgi:thymidylate synthase